MRFSFYLGVTAVIYSSNIDVVDAVRMPVSNLDSPYTLAEIHSVTDSDSVTYTEPASDIHTKSDSFTDLGSDADTGLSSMADAFTVAEAEAQGGGGDKDKDDGKKDDGKKDEDKKDEDKDKKFTVQEGIDSLLSDSKKALVEMHSQS